MQHAATFSQCFHAGLLSEVYLNLFTYIVCKAIDNLQL